MTETGPRDDERTQVQRSWTEAGAVIAVTEAVAAVTGNDLTELSPLHGHIEMDAVERMLDGQREGSVTVSFSYESTTVSIASDGELFVTRNERLDE